jgi:hypothetical protein
MTEGLYNAAQEEEQATGPSDELQKQIESGTFSSTLLGKLLSFIPYSLR